MNAIEIKTIRKFYGWTQAKLAEKLGLSKWAVQKWERVNNPSPVSGPSLIIMEGLKSKIEENEFEYLKKIVSSEIGKRGRPFNSK